MKGKIYIKQILLKEKEMYKILIDKAFTKDEDSPLKKIEPHKKFNTRWGTIYKRFSRKRDIENVP